MRAGVEKVGVLGWTKSGMNIDALGNGKVLMFMKYYIEETIVLYNEDLDTTVSSPAKKYRIKVRVFQYWTI